MTSQTITPRRGAKSKEDTRGKLICVGVQMLHKKGYTATGINDIVAGAEVPKGSFYNYFESKESFGSEVVSAYFDNSLVRLRELLCDNSMPPLERLRSYFDEQISSFTAGGYICGCMLGNLSLEIADQIAPIRNGLAGYFRTWSSLFETCISDAQNTGAISSLAPAALLAEFLLNSWQGALIRMRVEKSDAPLNEFTEVAFKLLLV